MAKSITLTLTDGANLELPSLINSTDVVYQTPFTGGWSAIDFPQDNSWWYYENGNVSAIQFYDLSTYVSDMGNKPNYRYHSDFTGAYSSLLEGVSSDVYNSQVWADMITSLENNTKWLWGSATDGGMCIYKSAESTSDLSTYGYGFVLFSGVYHNVEDDLYYLRTVNSDRIPLDFMHNVGFFIQNDVRYYSTQIDNYADLDIFSAPTPSHENFHWFYTRNYTDLTVAVMGGYPSACASEIGYYTDLSTLTPVAMPLQPFYYDSGYGRFSHYPHDETDDEKISGSPYGADWDFNTNSTDAGGTSTTGGGYGVPSNDSDDIDGESAESLNQLTCINSGLVTLYNPTASELSSFASFLYTGITDSIATQLKKLISNPLEYIVFVALCKFQPPVSGIRENISFAGVSSGVSANKISNQFYEVDCGTIQINEQFKSFLDYTHSKIKIYLPFCGVHEIACDDTMQGAVNVNYLIDMLSGTCVARVKVNRSSRMYSDPSIRSVLYEFNGNVYLTMPLSATDWRGTYSAMVNFAGGVVQGASGNTMGAVGSIASAVTSQKVSVARSGQAGSNYGYLGNKKPYLILERPIQSVPSNYGGFIGYTSNIRERVANLKGYTEISEDTIWSDNFGHATEEECEMIKSIMNGGVYL